MSSNIDLNYSKYKSVNPLDAVTFMNILTDRETKIYLFRGIHRGVIGSVEMIRRAKMPQWLFLDIIAIHSEIDSKWAYISDAMSIELKYADIGNKEILHVDFPRWRAKLAGRRISGFYMRLPHSTKHKIIDYTDLVFNVLNIIRHTNRPSIILDSKEEAALKELKKCNLPKGLIKVVDMPQDCDTMITVTDITEL